MKKVYLSIENKFEKFTEAALSVFGNSLTFILALSFVIYWLTESILRSKDWHDVVHDFLLGITFLSFFIIQKSFNKYNKALHIKLNELVSAHENASNDFVNIGQKTEEELNKIAEKHTDIVTDPSTDTNINS